VGMFRVRLSEACISEINVEMTSIESSTDTAFLIPLGWDGPGAVAAADGAVRGNSGLSMIMSEVMVDALVKGKKKFL